MRQQTAAKTSRLAGSKQPFVQLPGLEAPQAYAKLPEYYSSCRGESVFDRSDKADMEVCVCIVALCVSVRLCLSAG